MSEERKLEIAAPEGERLAVRWAPAESADTLLYLHGFGSSQAGEKAESFRRRAVARGTLVELQPQLCVLR